MKTDIIKIMRIIYENGHKAVYKYVFGPVEWWNQLSHTLEMIVLSHFHTILSSTGRKINQRPQQYCAKNSFPAIKTLGCYSFLVYNQNRFQIGHCSVEILNLFLTAVELLNIKLAWQLENFESSTKWIMKRPRSWCGAFDFLPSSCSCC